MTALSAQQIATNWANNLGAATAKITAGVNAVTVAPGQAAAAQKAAYIANTTAKAGVWATNTAAVSLTSWQQDTINKGIPRVATGAQAATSKMASVMTSLLPAIADAKASLPPRGNLQQNLQRANQFATALANQAGKFKA